MARQRRPGGRGVTFVEHQIDNAQYRVESIGQIIQRGNLVRYVRAASAATFKSVCGSLSVMGCLSFAQLEIILLQADGSIAAEQLAFVERI